jgi:hypothetical protein
VVGGTIEKLAAGVVSVTVATNVDQRRTTSVKRTKILDGRWHTRVAVSKVIRDSTRTVYITARFAGSPGVQLGVAKRRVGF